MILLILATTSAGHRRHRLCRLHLCRVRRAGGAKLLLPSAEGVSGGPHLGWGRVWVVGLILHGGLIPHGGAHSTRRASSTRRANSTRRGSFHTEGLILHGGANSTRRGPFYTEGLIPHGGANPTRRAHSTRRGSLGRVEPVLTWKAQPQRAAAAARRAWRG